MGPLLVGVVSVGLAVGLMVGRTTERARRGFRDLATAKATVTKGRKIAYADLRKAIGAVLLIGVILLALFVGMINASR